MMFSIFLDYLAEIAGVSALLFTVFASIFEVSKIQINPWSRLFGFIGKAINKEVLEKANLLETEINAIGAELDNVKKDVQDHYRKMDEEYAKRARSRILRFGDECLHDVKHSKEHFDEIMRDITGYNHYCDTHPEFENNTAVNTIKLINEIYLRRMREHDFL